MTKTSSDRRKLAVMTIFQVPNLGSVLQSYATQILFENLGYQCEIINYKYPNSWHYKNEASVCQESPVIKVLRRISKFFGFTGYHRFLKKIDSFRNKYLRLSPLFDSLESLENYNWNDYACVVAGSDQIWNHRFVLGDSAFMLSFVPDFIKKVSLASSFASDHIPDNLIEKYKSNLNRFNFLGIREKNGISIIRNQLGLSTRLEVIFDPTLLISKDEWTQRLNLSSYNIKEQYILLYILDYAFDPYPYILEVAEYFSQKLNLPVKVVAGKKQLLKKYLSRYKNCSESSPAEFVNLVRQANLVITSSFHGTAFSVNFERPLISISPSGGDDRQQSLLRTLGIELCNVPIGQSIDTINPYYDYKETGKALAGIRNQQVGYYKTILAE